MKYVIALIFLSFSFSNIAQTSLSNYEYLIVPKQFEIFNEDNKHGLNTMLFQYFKQEGFKVFYADSLPSLLANNNCLGLSAQLEERKGFFKTRVTVILKNCYGNTVWKSNEGESSEKSFGSAYREALRYALKSFEQESYSYTPPKVVPPVKPLPPKSEVAVEKESDVAIIDENTDNRADELYELAMTSNGFSLYNSNTKSFIGSGLKSKIAEFYHFKSDDISGIAVFDDKKLTVEYYSDGKLVTRVFLLQ